MDRSLRSLVSSLSAVALVSAALVLAGCNPDVEAARLLREAERVDRAKQPEKARALYERYLEESAALGATRDPAIEGRVRRRLAGRLAADGDTRSARRLYLESVAGALAIRSDPEISESLRGLVDLLASTGDHATALEVTRRARALGVRGIGDGSPGRRLSRPPFRAAAAAPPAARR